jgi:hypothetical protein
MRKALEIYCSLASKDSVVDCLLARGIEDFYFFPCSRYGAGSFLVSAEEQVSARAKFGVFRLFTDGQDTPDLADMLKAHLKDKTIRMFSYDVHEM